MIRTRPRTGRCRAAARNGSCSALRARVGPAASAHSRPSLRLRGRPPRLRPAPTGRWPDRYPSARQWPGAPRGASRRVRGTRGRAGSRPDLLFDAEPPDPRHTLDSALVVLGGLGRGAALDHQAVTVPDAGDLRVHQAGNTVLARQDAEMRPDGAPGADHT